MDSDVPAKAVVLAAPDASPAPSSEKTKSLIGRRGRWCPHHLPLPPSCSSESRGGRVVGRPPWDIVS